jgi:hypothetical protein
MSNEKEVRMLKLLAFVKDLYGQVQGSPETIRARALAAARAAFAEIKRSGTIPFCLIRLEGDDQFVWLVFDRSKFASAMDLQRYAEARCPAGAKVTLLFLRDKK